MTDVYVDIVYRVYSVVLDRLLDVRITQLNRRKLFTKKRLHKVTGWYGVHNTYEPGLTVSFVRCMGRTPGVHCTRWLKGKWEKLYNREGSMAVGPVWQFSIVKTMVRSITRYC